MMALHNDFNVPIWVDYTYADQDQPHGIRHDQVQLGRHEEKDVAVWFGKAPPTLSIRVTANGKTWYRKFLKREFPPNVLAESSLSTTFDVHMNEDGIKIGPNFMDQFGTLLWVLVGLSAFIMVPLIVARYLNRRPKVEA
jgi:hypothetical protein